MLGRLNGKIALVSISLVRKPGLSAAPSVSPILRATDVAARDPTATQSDFIISLAELLDFEYDIASESAHKEIITLEFAAERSSV
jgi:hypothetical protein